VLKLDIVFQCYFLYRKQLQLTKMVLIVMLLISKLYVMYQCPAIHKMLISI